MHPLNDKIKGSQRVIYSINMAVYTYLFLKMEDVNITNLNNHNCHLETFLTHVRNLSWFFYKKEKYDDIFVGDFTSEINTEKIDDEIKSAINKSLAHLTYYKIDQKPLWNYHSIAMKLFPVCLLFLEDTFFIVNEIEPRYSEIRLELIDQLKTIVHSG